MKANILRHRIVINSKAPPTVEVDTEAMAVYVRFKQAKIARTESRPVESGSIAIDFDAAGEVVGLEAIGMTEFDFNVKAILKIASIEAPHADLEKARYVAARELVGA